MTIERIGEVARVHAADTSNKPSDETKKNPDTGDQKPKWKPNKFKFDDVGMIVTHVWDEVLGWVPFK